MHFEFLSHFFHSDAVTGLSVCSRKPLVATCSVDCSVRIWNYESKYEEPSGSVLGCVKEFNESYLVLFIQ